MHLTEETQAARPAMGSAGLGVSALVALTVLCGCACQAPYEVMNSRDRGCGALVSFVEHVFGILASLGAVRQGRKLPLALHAGLAAASVGYTLLLNQALSSELPTLVLITMKNGNLAANMLLGACVMRYRYTHGQCLAVSCITVGLVLASLSGGRGTGIGHPTDTNGAGWSAALGIVSLTGALLSRAAAGMLQEATCKGYDAPVSELLLYRSALGLPLVLLQWGDISHHATRWSSDDQVAGLVWPTLWLLLAANIAFDYATKVFISKLIDRTSSLTATLVLTFQRFVSFVISTSFLSADPVGWDLWVSAVAVLVGTVLYVTAAKPLAPSASKSKCA